MSVRPASLALVLAGVAAMAAIATCAIEVPLEGKACPCVEGYLCDEVENECLAESCAVSASRISVRWQTPHSLAFDIRGVGEAARFLRYELVVAESKRDVESRAGTARVITSAEHVELDAFSGGGALVVVDGLAADTTYFAELVAVDSDECASRSSVLAAETSAEPANDPIVIYDAADQTTWPALQPGAAGLMSGVVEYVLAEDECCIDVCGDEPDVGARSFCGQPLKLDRTVLLGATSGQANLVRADTFEDAYLEIELLYDSPFAAVYGTVWLSPQDGPAEFRFDGLTFAPTTGFATIEVPLRFLAQSGVALEHAVLASGPIDQFAIGGQWHRDATLRLRAVRVRH